MSRSARRARTTTIAAMLELYTLRLHGIRFKANLGASRSERSLPQEIVVAVELALPVDALPTRDHRQNVVDYDAIAGLVVEEGRAAHYRLLETYARRLLERLLAETPALRVTVAATKLRVPSIHNVDGAVVELSASRDAPRAHAKKAAGRVTSARRTSRGRR